ncbi:DUF2490 domain-containing protein [Rhodobacteraceae bacterium NNCM2]|nr:DUF2490 domain-containing protein [Coraliihabitans acroporae]
MPGLLAATSACLIAVPAQSVEPDLQSWNILKADIRLADHWGVALEAEMRIADDISEVDEIQLKPTMNYLFDDHMIFGAGYKFTEKPGKPNENDIFQEFTYKHGVADFALEHKFTLEERFVEDVPGILPRVTYTFGVSYPLNKTVYLKASEQARFNLRDTGAGPVGGFEQNRVFAGLGFRVDHRVKIELGYLWRYERERSGPPKSDNVVQVQFVLTGDARR